MNSITLLQPDDWHAHLRDGLALKRTVPDLAKQFARAICMPNLVPPVKTVEEALKPPYSFSRLSFNSSGK
ncbi:hypothetical protein A7A57_14795 [Acinetobacter baumannii]|nr:hypothetical protein A7A57_14795 [Acinetobacter baumannii]